MSRKFVPDEIAEKFAKIFGVSTPDNDCEKNEMEETVKEHIVECEKEKL